jgi:pimeloyl-ACP methyl ester carboxylesterase
MSGGESVEARSRPPVLLLAGIGLTAAVALRVAAPLQERFRVLSTTLGAVGDSRSAGAPAVTTVENAVALLDDAGAEQAHVVGLSFGAAIAQEITIRHPDRVRSLVLGSATAGGKLYVAPERPVRQFLRRLPDLPAEEGLWATVPYLYAETTWHLHAPLIGEDIARRIGRPLEPRAYRAQHASARAHDASTRLAAITVPTLVIHGENDRILPPGNGRLLAGAIAGAQFIALATGAHGFPTDVPEAGEQLVSFLLAHSQSGGRRRAARNGRAGRA